MCNDNSSESNNSNRDANYFSHYTSLGVLRKLLENPVFRMYRSTYMNDPTEGKILFEYLADLKSFYSKKDGGNLDDHDVEEDDVHAYIGSFVKRPRNEDSDDPFLYLMWRLYGDDGRGSSITLTRGALDDANKALSSKFDGDSFQFTSDKNSSPEDDTGRLHRTADGTLKKIPLFPEVQREFKTQEVFSVFFIKITYLKKYSQIIAELVSISRELAYLKELVGVSSMEDKETTRRLVRFVMDKIRFLYKNKSYKNEEEYRILCISHVSKVELDEERNKFYMPIKSPPDQVPDQVSDPVPFLFRSDSMICIGPSAHEKENEKDIIQYWKEKANRKKIVNSRREMRKLGKKIYIEEDYEYDVEISKIDYRSSQKT